MRLATFIRNNLDPLLDEWEKFARVLPHASSLGPAALRDHARGILLEIAGEMESARTAHEQDDKSPDFAPFTLEVSDAELHGLSRFTEGFNVNDARRIPRAAHRGAAAVERHSAADAAEITRFNQAIDQAVTDSLARSPPCATTQSRLFDALLSSSPDLAFIIDPAGAHHLRQQGVRPRIPQGPANCRAPTSLR